MSKYGAMNALEVMNAISIIICLCQVQPPQPQLQNQQPSQAQIQNNQMQMMQVSKPAYCCEWNRIETVSLFAESNEPNESNESEHATTIPTNARKHVCEYDAATATAKYAKHIWWQHARRWHER